jgi:hypothetical protein
MPDDPQDAERANEPIKPLAEKPVLLPYATPVKPKPGTGPLARATQVFFGICVGFGGPVIGMFFLVMVLDSARVLGGTGATYLIGIICFFAAALFLVMSARRLRQPDSSTSSNWFLSATLIAAGVAMLIEGLCFTLQ